MIAGGVVGALGLAALIVLTQRALRLAALGATTVGGAILVVTLRPEGNDALVAAAGVVGAVAAVGLGALFVRWPWLLPMAALACAPARVPVKVGGDEASLLLPLYLVVAGGVVALGWELWRGDARSRELGLVAWPLAAFLAWSGVSLLWSDGPRQGAVSLAAFFLPFGLLALMVARLPWQRRWLKALTVELLAMAARVRRDRRVAVGDARRLLEPEGDRLERVRAVLPRELGLLGPLDLRPLPRGRDRGRARGRALRRAARLDRTRAWRSSGSGSASSSPSRSRASSH